MSTDPADHLSDLRRIRDEALEHRFGDALVDAYHRGSISMAWQDIVDAEKGDPLPLLDTFRVEVLGVSKVPSRLAGLISAGVQRATTQMDGALLRPQSSALRPSREDLIDTLVIQEGAAGNTLIFRAPAAVLGHGAFDIGAHPSRAGRALQELMNVLPENREDIGSFVRGIGRAPVLERQAVQTISRVALESPFGLGLNFESPRTSVRSNFDRQSAEQVDDYLRDRSVKPSTEQHSGILDGFRGTRRVFYLITDDGREIAGSVDDGLLPTVRRLAGTRVMAHLAVTQWAARSGQLGPKHYDLLKLEPEPEPPALFSE
ncbi:MULTISPECIES: hypothetical protein [Mycobacterium]|uniref:Glucose-6-phosphate 1-dehydrogenase n=1 Tax=Mycobacterium indicus pranii (strain DSM 45239 / MTCC 9506) TaxID=1232724 RepID=J9WNR1_MYCIP|nr:MULTISPECIES: hypothetical protein [Mycobacterium]AFS17041.1 Glucose-6-phosphate 1-dehydrogenase [Mycobacterium intracellulare subsp. intracellulare MTCC 9506]WSE51711.1 hypothetical protein QGN31_00970 [Mycobacterium sp. 2-64]BCO54562.1 hypothetical protein MINTM003_50030 [Mycobacterium paraintracellulare]BCO91830.1 hypothetical protein MINTM015_50870 [Mycobacterium paraintracellulare]